jgi:tellurite resistance protein
LDLKEELLKLLVQLVWADGEQQDSEVDAVRRAANALGASLASRQALERWLSHAEPLPPPNLELLRAQRGPVLRLARAILETDGIFTPEEARVLETLETLLAAPPAR